MKHCRTAVLCVAALLVAALGSDLAEARPGHRHSHGGARVVFFAPVFVPRFYYSSPYYYYPYYPPPVYYVPPPTYYAPPPVYIEQPQPQLPPQLQSPQQPQPQSEAYWYFCPASQGYYPYVRQCPGGWQRVAPQPPPG